MTTIKKASRIQIVHRQRLAFTADPPNPGIPETPSISGKSTPSVPSSVGSQTSTKGKPSSGDTPTVPEPTRHPVSVGKIVQSMDVSTPSYAAVAAVIAKDNTSASLSSHPPISNKREPPQSTPNVDNCGTPDPVTPQEEWVHFPATDVRERLPKNTKDTVSRKTPETKPTPKAPKQPPSPTLVTLVATPELLQQILASPEQVKVPQLQLHSLAGSAQSISDKAAYKR